MGSDKTQAQAVGNYAGAARYELSGKHSCLVPGKVPSRSQTSFPNTEESLRIFDLFFLHIPYDPDAEERTHISSSCPEKFSEEANLAAKV